MAASTAQWALLGGNFTRICALAPELDANGNVQHFLPQDRFRNSRHLPLNAYGAGPFCRFRIPACLRIAGVYVLAVGLNVRYVGECANLSERFNSGYGNISPRNCFRGGQETNCRINNLVLTEAVSHKCVLLYFFETAERKDAEAKLISALRPPWNLAQRTSF